MVKPFRMRYVVKGTDHYVIEFRPQSDGAIKMFVINHPADPWGKTVVVHHLYTNGTICVAAGHEPRTADRARAIAQVWAAGWSSYIRTGTFPSGSQKVNIVTGDRTCVARRGDRPGGGTATGKHRDPRKKRART